MGCGSDFGTRTANPDARVDLHANAGVISAGTGVPSDVIASRLIPQTPIVDMPRVVH